MAEAGIVVVGAGEAGARAVASLRERGYGGPLTLLGEEAHGPYERPPLSKGVLTAEDEQDGPPSILDPARLQSLAVAHRAGACAVAIDREAHLLLLADGASVPYTKLLLAVGAGPRRLHLAGAGPGDILHLRTFGDALALRRRLRPGARIVIVGGGFIGLEVAESAVARGCRVAVVEAAPRILQRGVPEEIARRVAQVHLDAGVDLRTGVGLAGIERAGGKTAVALADGSTLPCDEVIAGIGAVPRTELAEAAGLAVENGIRVDDRLRTDDPAIWAAGDCCSFPHPLYGGGRMRLEAWRNAQDQGAAAAANMLGADEPYAKVPWFWSDQYDQTLQVAGLASFGRITVERKLDGAAMLFHLDQDGRLMAASAFGPNGAIARDVKLAEMLIARRAQPDPDKLADRSVGLKSLLR
ncbi:MAG: FAD-dependent oxidoreductase [Geminicoccaceae bacterium]